MRQNEVFIPNGRTKDGPWIRFREGDEQRWVYRSAVFVEYEYLIETIE